MLITFRTNASISTLVQWHKTYTEHRNELNRKGERKKEAVSKSFANEKDLQLNKVFF